MSVIKADLFKNLRSSTTWTSPPRDDDPAAKCLAFVTDDGNLRLMSAICLTPAEAQALAKFITSMFS